MLVKIQSLETGEGEIITYARHFKKVIMPVFATPRCRVGLGSWTLWLTGCGLVACKILVKIPSPEPAKS